MSNSFWIGITVASLTLTIGTLTSFTIGRLRIRQGWMLTNAALMTYVIPMSFLAIPFYGIMGKYGMTDNPLAVIAVEVTFATPYAIFIFQQYSASIPYELDEAARIDGASPPQIFFKIYLPLMAPALVAIGTYALLLSWNEYLYVRPARTASSRSAPAPAALQRRKQEIERISLRRSGPRDGVSHQHVSGVALSCLLPLRPYPMATAPGCR